MISLKASVHTIQSCSDVAHSKFMLPSYIKTAQEIGMFQSKKFMTRYYTLNPATATLMVQDSPTDSDDPTIHEFRRNRLIKVDTEMRN